MSNQVKLFKSVKEGQGNYLSFTHDINPVHYWTLEFQLKNRYKLVSAYKAKVLYDAFFLFSSDLVGAFNSFEPALVWLDMLLYKVRPAEVGDLLFSIDLDVG